MKKICAIALLVIAIPIALLVIKTLDETSPFVYDEPESVGAKNALLRFEQIIKLTYTPQNDIPQSLGAVPALSVVQGLPYSSTRPEALFVPNNVSIYTYMTALENPNSYLYTVDLSKEPYNNVNGSTYYGAVCSTAVAYALDITPNYSTHSWHLIPGMYEVDASGLEALKLCDTVVGEGHVVMITGIQRTHGGEVVEILISEASGANTHQKAYTSDAFKERFPCDKYKFYRYEGLSEVTYEPSPFVAIGEEKATEEL